MLFGESSQDRKARLPGYLTASWCNCVVIPDNNKQTLDDVGFIRKNKINKIFITIVKLHK